MSAGRLFSKARAGRLFLLLTLIFTSAGIIKFSYHCLPCFGNWCQAPGVHFFYVACFTVLGIAIMALSYRSMIAWTTLLITLALPFFLEVVLVSNQVVWLYLVQTGVLAAACLTALKLFFGFPGITLRAWAGIVFFLIISGVSSIFLYKIDRVQFQDGLSDEYASLKTYQKIFYDMERRGRAEIKLLAVQPGIEKLFQAGNTAHELKSWAKILGASAVYAMDKSGNVVSSSAPAFIGKNYGFRPYFQLALRGRSNVFLGKGVTTGVEGIYFARPVIKKKKIQGVLVMKMDIDKVLGRDFKRSEILLMVKPGIILYGPERFSGGLIGKMTPRTVSYLNRQKILGTSHPRSLGLKALGKGLYRFPDGRLYKLVNLPIYGQSVSVARFYPLSSHLSYRLELLLLFLILGLIYFLLFMKLVHNRDFVSRLKCEVRQRRKAEKRLRVLAAAIEQAAEAVMITDARGRIEYVNSAFTAVTGYSREDVLGRSPSILKSGTHDEAFYKNLWETIKAGRVWRGRFTNRKKDGSLVQDETTIFPVKNDDGSINRFVAVKKDITREANLEAQLLHAQKMESVGVLAGGIAHDFNNILAAIQVNLDLMRSKRGDAGMVARYLQKIQYSVSRASDLVQQLLLFSRRETFRVSRIDLNESISRMAKMIRGMLTENIDLVIELEDYPWRIRADSEAIDQVIMNLVVNAADAMPHGGILYIKTKNVYLKDKMDDLAPGRYVMLTVSDTGMGMDGRTLQHIFVPFFTTKGVGAGTGLGLSMVYGIVRQFDGTIQVRSRPGEGSSFEIYFPASLAAAFLLKEQNERKREGVGERILLVEDEDTISSVIAEALQENNYQVLRVRDDGEAMAVLGNSSGSFSMVIMDAALAERDCLGLFQAVSGKTGSLPVLFIMDEGDLPDCFAGKSCRNIQVVKKPFRISELLRSVKEVLEKKCA